MTNWDREFPLLSKVVSWNIMWQQQLVTAVSVVLVLVVGEDLPLLPRMKCQLHPWSSPARLSKLPSVEKAPLTLAVPSWPSPSSSHCWIKAQPEGGALGRTWQVEQRGGTSFVKGSLLSLAEEKAGWSCEHCSPSQGVSTINHCLAPGPAVGVRRQWRSAGGGEVWKG